MRIQGYPAAACATLTPCCAGWWLLGWEYKGILQQPVLPSLPVVQADACWDENTRVSCSSLGYPHSLLCRLMAAGMRIQGYPAAVWATLTKYCAGWWLLGWEYKGILQQSGLPSLHIVQADGCWDENTRVSCSSLGYPHSIFDKKDANLILIGRCSSHWLKSNKYFSNVHCIKKLYFRLIRHLRNRCSWSLDYLTVVVIQGTVAWDFIIWNSLLQSIRLKLYPVLYPFVRNHLQEIAVLWGLSSLYIFPPKKEKHSLL